MSGDAGLAALSAATADFAAARDWQPWHTPKNLVMALSGEVGELTALFQWLTPEQSAAVMADEEAAADVRDELADVVLYLVQLARVLDVDLIEAANAKLARNEHRFPASGVDQRA
ncbi:nucleotide pyrophosphohydrolase [Cryptosporangium sp. NPDC051539]|uniref:nucleotide pyrophosphohydrolase n=1 Tax=Cryptosporangium sp. NPDC051539 TaxID=3363962 RepID=UPI0037B39CAF